MHITRNRKNKTFAIPADAAAMPPNPSTAATNSVTKKVTAHADRRLVGRHRVDHHRRRPASRVRAAGVRVPVSRDLPLGRPAVLDRRTYPVRLDYVVFP